MPSSSSTARASTSCRRCHRRKKRCDRTLPQCETCIHAQVECSFLDDDRQVGTYPIAYVQGLESRVKELEKQLSAALASTPYPNLQLDQDFDQPVINFATPPDTDNRDTYPIATPPSHNRSDFLVDELKRLSLEAAAERHLGSSSGLSFAKLTQAVLRRLSPDKAEFVFDDTPDESPEQYGEPFSDPLLDASTSLWELNNSFSSPCLFNQLPLSHVMEDETTLADLQLPDRAHIEYLMEFYFAHSHTLYPIIRQTEFTSVIWRVYNNPQDPLAGSPLWMFRIWMVLAIGSTTHCSVTLGDESESVLYYNKAMGCFEDALGLGDMAALEVMMLQVSYSFFNQVGPNTFFLVGVAARMAIGIGLHSSSSYANLPSDVIEYRKRIFFSLYMMDRVVSIALGRPFAIHDADIDVEPFTDTTTTDDLTHTTNLSIPLHILSLRRIASEITTALHSPTNTHNSDRQTTLQTLHKKLLHWRRTMPFPLLPTPSPIPHLTSAWFDLNYYTHMTMLYRPSPLFPSLDEQKVKVLATAAAMAIRQAMNLHRQGRFAYNWLNLLGVFQSAVALMYATLARPDELGVVVRESKVVEDLGLVVELLRVFGRKFGVAGRLERIVGVVVGRLGEFCEGGRVGVMV
ncbi:transcriptional regulator family: Fungal Specific TF [Aspergillus niger]|nr:transcriptional regulator family: Fungal Specific TF [Aspergillus niger]